MSLPALSTLQCLTRVFNIPCKFCESGQYLYLPVEKGGCNGHRKWIDVIAKILVSSCLLGEKTRYDGGHSRMDSPILEQWEREGRIISFCPEVEGGCPIPRIPCEIIDGDGDMVIDGEARVLNVRNQDFTAKYIRGAEKALRVAQKNGVSVALLKARSPSCGSKQIYDGTFLNSLKPGKGVTTALLERNGIRVLNEDEIEEAEDYLRRTKV